MIDTLTIAYDSLIVSVVSALISAFAIIIVLWQFSQTRDPVIEFDLNIIELLENPTKSGIIHLENVGNLRASNIRTFIFQPWTDEILQAPTILHKLAPHQKREVNIALDDPPVGKFTVIISITIEYKVYPILRKSKEVFSQKYSFEKSLIE